MLIQGFVRHSKWYYVTAQILTQTFFARIFCFTLSFSVRSCQTVCSKLFILSFFVLVQLFVFVLRFFVWQLFTSLTWKHDKKRIKSRDRTSSQKFFLASVVSLTNIWEKSCKSFLQVAWECSLLTFHLKMNKRRWKQVLIFEMKEF